MAGTPLGAEKAASAMRELFDVIDTDHDGRVEWGDLESGIHRSDPAKARELMECAADSPDRTIDFDTFTEFFDDRLGAEGLSLETLTQEHVQSFKSHFAGPVGIIC